MHEVDDEGLFGTAQSKRIDPGRGEAAVVILAERVVVGNERAGLAAGGQAIEEGLCQVIDRREPSARDWGVQEPARQAREREGAQASRASEESAT